MAVHTQAQVHGGCVPVGRQFLKVCFNAHYQDCGVLKFNLKQVTSGYH